MLPTPAKLFFSWENSPPGSQLLLGKTGQFGEAALGVSLKGGMPASVGHTSAVEQCAQMLTFLPETCTGRSARESGSRGGTVRLYYKRHPGKEIKGRLGSKGWCYILKNYLLLWEPHLKTRYKSEKGAGGGRKFHASMC